MHVMKTVFAVLLLASLAEAQIKVLVTSKVASPISTASATVTFTFSSSVSGFSADSFEVRSINQKTGGNGVAPVRGEARSSSSSFQRWVVTLSNLSNDHEYTISVPAGRVEGCTVSGNRCNVGDRAATNGASNSLSFVSYVGSVLTDLYTDSNSQFIITGSTDLNFSAEFDHEVYPHDGLAGIVAKDQRNQALNIKEVTFGKKVWTYAVEGRNGDSVISGVAAGAAVDRAGNPSDASDPRQIQRTLNIRQNCETKLVFEAWGPCQSFTRTQTRIGYPTIEQPAMFGGLCDLQPKVETRSCTPGQTCRGPTPFTNRCNTPAREASVSVQYVNGVAVQVPVAGDSCDCTPACLNNGNCCPDVADVCGLGCMEADCGGRIDDVNNEPICYCDWECKANGDCCGDFEQACKGRLCGMYLLDGVPADELCSAEFEDDDDATLFCDSMCTEYNDCAPDYYAICNKHTSCASKLEGVTQWHKCGQPFYDCGCDILCPYYGDCCPDYGAVCAWSSNLPAIHNTDWGAEYLTALGLGPEFEDVPSYTANPNSPPETCSCVANGLGDTDCCGTDVGYLGRRCSCEPVECAKYNDCCPDIARSCPQ